MDSHVLRLGCVSSSVSPCDTMGFFVLSVAILCAKLPQCLYGGWIDGADENATPLDF